MALILNLETATTVCSVALGSNGALLFLEEMNEDYTHAEKLTLYIEHVLNKEGFKLNDLDAIAISKGPGSYTGLRIGTSTAKGLCYALNKPLIAINTLRSMANGIVDSAKEQYYCPMIDARRMEVYCAIYDFKNKEIRKTAAEIIDEHSFSELLEKNKIVFFGDGAAKCKTKLTHHHAIFMDDVFNSAKNMLSLSQLAFDSGHFEDVAYFEPYYLKDFIPGIKKII